LFGVTSPKTEAPSTTPAASLPSTEGWPIAWAAAANSFAVPSMITSNPRNCGTSKCSINSLFVHEA
jgi:hypothetical protein